MEVLNKEYYEDIDEKYFSSIYEVDEDKLNSEYFLDNLVFINDGLWGDGMYKFGCDHEIEKIKNIMENAKYNLDGSICVRFNGVLDLEFYNKALRELQYCRLFSQTEFSLIKNIESTVIAHIEYDSESG